MRAAGFWQAVIKKLQTKHIYQATTAWSYLRHFSIMRDLFICLPLKKEVDANHCTLIIPRSLDAPIIQVSLYDRGIDYTARWQMLNVCRQKEIKLGHEGGTRWMTHSQSGKGGKKGGRTFAAVLIRSNETVISSAVYTPAPVCDRVIHLSACPC